MKSVVFLMMFLSFHSFVEACASADALTVRDIGYNTSISSLPGSVEKSFALSDDSDPRNMYAQMKRLNVSNSSLYESASASVEYDARGRFYLFSQRYTLLSSAGPSQSGFINDLISKYGRPCTHGESFFFEDFRKFSLCWGAGCYIKREKYSFAEYTDDSFCRPNERCLIVHFFTKGGRVTKFGTDLVDQSVLEQINKDRTRLEESISQKRRSQAVRQAL